MTPQELELLRLQARIVAVESMLVTLFAALVNTPSSRTALLEKLKAYPDSLGDMAISGVSPEYSDLYSAELQDAVESLNSFLIKRVEKAQAKTGQ
jgi:hypothetical protein